MLLVFAGDNQTGREGEGVEEITGANCLVTYNTNPDHYKALTQIYEFVESLEDVNFCHVFVVNDGDLKYASLFAELETHFYGIQPYGVHIWNEWTLWNEEVIECDHFDGAIQEAHFHRYEKVYIPKK